jgi:undecaprenyl-diphosphatase
MILIFKHQGLNPTRSTFFISLNLIVFGMIMGLVDKYCPKKSPSLMKKFQVVKSLFLGVGQGFGIFPGVSRLGATMTVSRLLGNSRKDSAKYSFLISLPVVFGGFLLQLKRLPRGFSPHLLPSLEGFAIAFFLGLIFLHLFMKSIGKIGLMPFTFYRITLGIFIFLNVPF